MLNSKRRYQKNSGFTLIEIVLAFGISSILFLAIISLNNSSTRSLKYVEENDETYLYGRFIVDYIKSEVKEADSVISSDKIKDLDKTYPNNLGFVIMRDWGEEYKAKNHPYRYNYCMYYLDDSKLIRNACNRSTNKYPIAKDFSGYNEIYDQVLSVEGTKVNKDTKLMELYILIGSNKSNTSLFKSTIYIHNNIDY